MRSLAPGRPRIVLGFWALGALLCAAGWWLLEGPVDGYRTEGGTVVGDYQSYPGAPTGILLADHPSLDLNDDSYPKNWSAGDQVTAFERSTRITPRHLDEDHIVFLRVATSRGVTYTSADSAAVGNLEGDLQSQQQLAWIPIFLGGATLILTFVLVISARRRRSLLIVELGAATCASSALVVWVPVFGGPLRVSLLLIAPVAWVAGLVIGWAGLARSDPAGDGKGHLRDLVLCSLVLPVAAVVGLIGLTLQI